MDDASRRPQTREERQVVEMLSGFERIAQLPSFAELEPGSVLHRVREAWSNSQGRDGRRGHLSDSDVAHEMSRTMQQPYSRNQYQVMFGEGRRLADEARYQQGITREIARAFLVVALTN